MGLDSIISKQVQKAMKTVKSLARQITYTSVANGSYSPATDSVSTTTVTVPAVTAVFEKLYQNELDMEIRNLVDVKILIAALDLPGITPQTEDTVSDASDVYRIKKVDTVPGNSLWILYARKG